MSDAKQITKLVKEKYGAIAAQVTDASVGESASCCGPADCGCGGETSVITSDLYDLGQTEGLPSDALTASLGCGNPTALAELKSGETVLDLGSGGGIDCFMAAKQVGETGHVIGVDMTPAMIQKADQNKAKVEASNVEFRLGQI